MIQRLKEIWRRPRAEEAMRRLFFEDAKYSGDSLIEFFKDYVSNGRDVAYYNLGFTMGHRDGRRDAGWRRDRQGSPRKGEA